VNEKGGLVSRHGGPVSCVPRSSCLLLGDDERYNFGSPTTNNYNGQRERPPPSSTRQLTIFGLTPEVSISAYLYVDSTCYVSTYEYVYPVSS